MNERIKQLTREAQAYATRIVGEDDINFNIWMETYEDKIAKLIVRECMELAMNEKSRYANLYNKEADQNKYLTMLHCATSMDNYRLLLKEHFGVEE